MILRRHYLFAALFCWVGSVAQPEPLDTFQDCDVCPVMIELPMGEFVMGGPLGDSRFLYVAEDGKIVDALQGDPRIEADERPLHRVEMDYPFAMGRDEVTHDQWMACVDAGGCRGHIQQDYVLRGNTKFDPSKVTIRGKHPVIDVSFEDAVAYTEWLNTQVGADVYRLPTEAEWEYAAWAGTQKRFAQGDEITTDQANFHGPKTAENLGLQDSNLVYRAQPVPVDTLDAANAWGLRHMSGNVGERTLSCYTERYAGWATASEWLAQSNGEDCIRATRGGQYGFIADFSRVAQRGGAKETHRSTVTGFRVLRELRQ